VKPKPSNMVRAALAHSGLSCVENNITGFFMSTLHDEPMSSNLTVILDYALAYGLNLEIS